MIPLFYKLMRGQAENVEEALPKVRQGLEGTMLGNGPFWLGGERPTLADIDIYPWFEREAVLEHYHALSISTTPRLKAWKEAMQALPEVKREMHDPSAYIQAYARYAPVRT